MSASNQHSELPTTAECDERIAEAQHVIDHPDDYDVEVRVQAHKDRARWQFNRRFAERVTNLEEQHNALRSSLQALVDWADGKAGDDFGDTEWTRAREALKDA